MKGVWKFPTNQGWLFESCPDVLGLPTCYLHMTYWRIDFGCVSELTHYHLTHYQRGHIYGSLNLCDGHYCNMVPDL